LIGLDDVDPTRHAELYFLLYSFWRCMVYGGGEGPIKRKKWPERMVGRGYVERR